MNSGGGIYVQTSPNVLLSDNTVSSNSYGTGIYVYQSPGAAISNNNVTRNGAGIDIRLSGNVTVLSNQFSWNILGLEIEGNNTVSSNTFSFDTVVIVCHCSGTNMTIRGNGFAYDGLTLDTYVGTYVPSFNITGNLVNNKPMLFYKDCSNIVINAVPVGQLIAVNCRNLQIRNVQVTNTVVGAQLVNVNNATIMNNSINSNSQ
jgi:parallel beta-helix repeat protein